MLRAQREHNGVVGRGGLQLEIKGAAESFAQRQPPRPVHPNAERRMQHELHASGFIEEALQHELLLRRDDTEGAVNRGEVVRQLPRAGVGEADVVRKPGGQGFLGLGPVSAQVSAILFSTSTRNRDTACDNSFVRPGASPNQKGIPGGCP